MLSSLDRPDAARSVAQFFSRATDQVTVAVKSLPTNHFVISPAWEVSVNEATRVSDASEFFRQFDKGAAELLFTSQAGPTVVQPLADLTVTEGSPQRSISLANLFSVDDLGSPLELTAVSSDPQLVSTVLDGSSLELHFGAARLGTAVVSVTATDAAGLTASDEFVVEVSPVTGDAPSRWVVADQVIDHQGHSVIRMAGAASRFPNVSISSSNSNVLATDELSVTKEGNDVVIRINHQSEDYGVSAVRLSDGDSTIAQFTAIVLPPANVNQADAGKLNLDIESEARTVNDTAGTQLRISYNDRALALMIRDGRVSSQDAVALTRPMEYRETGGLDPRDFPELNWQTVHGNSTDPEAPQTSHTITLVGGVSATERAPDRFDQIDSTLGAVSKAAVFLDHRLETVEERIRDTILDRSIEESFKAAVKGANFLIDVLDPDNDTDLNPAGDLVWGVTGADEGLYRPDGRRLRTESKQIGCRT